MIVSASRRTDIPRFHMDWFLNRLSEGYALVRNPMNRSSVSRVPLTPETIDCIAFWTKNPEPMLERLDELSPYPYYVQFTLNAYGADIEGALPPKADLIRTFQELSAAVGPHRMVWRYSPVLISERYTISHHLHYFETFAKRLEGFTSQCRISFLDVYPKIERLMGRRGLQCVAPEQEASFAQSLNAIAVSRGIECGGCGSMDLEAAGMKRAGCIDASFVERATGLNVAETGTESSREGCYCIPSVDIGASDTCAKGCVYCYANGGAERNAPRRFDAYDPLSEMLCDRTEPGDVIADRKATSLLVAQTSLVL